MVPEVTTCEACGRTVIVLSWAPVYDDVTELNAVDESHSLEISCKIDCPMCGTRIQNIAPAVDADRT